MLEIMTLYAKRPRFSPPTGCPSSIVPGKHRAFDRGDLPGDAANARDDLVLVGRDMGHSI